MRIAFFVLPFTIAIAGAGGLLMYHGRGLPRQDVGIDFDSPRHLITRQMEIETAAMANRRMPEVSEATEMGKPVTLAPSNGEKPQFVLFIKDECPCSIDAQPLFNNLARKYATSIDFYGVIDGGTEKAKHFASQFSVAFPVIGDDNLKLIHDYQAKAGVYSALIARNGHVVKMWPGYSADILREMNHYFAVAAALKETPFDPQYAPTKKAAGCAYSW